MAIGLAAHICAFGIKFELKHRMRIRTSFLRAVAFTMIAVAMPVFHAPAFAGPATCEDIFRKEKFLNPSLQIGEKGSIDIKLTNSKSVVGAFLNSLTRLIYRPLLLNKIEEVVERLVSDARDIPFWEKLSDAFGLEIEIDPKALDMIPRTRELIIVANHPLNGPEGIALAALISKVRPDIKVVLTPLLGVVPGMAQNAIFANPYGGENARRENVANIQQMVDHLKAGHAAAMFPSGTVSGKTQWRDTEAVDGRWKTGLAHLIREVPTTMVLPIYVEGQPSNTFLNVTLLLDRFLGKFPSLRTGIGVVFHVREIGSRIDQVVKLNIGTPIEGKKLLEIGSLAQVMNHLRGVTLDLKGKSERTVNLKSIEVKAPERVLAPIAPPGDMTSIHAELKSKARVIFDMEPGEPQKRMLVYLAKGSEIPETMQELGRLREITFREVGEGTGLARDIDSYDADYSHLIVIDKKSGDITGSYRVGFVDKLLETKGVEGLYSSLFFDHGKLITSKLRRSLELGRSFVVPKYQRRSLSLLALFSGIGQILVENPRYRYLIGPVSISNEISARSQDLIITYLKTYHMSPDALLVTAKTPVSRKLELSADDLAFIAGKPSLRDLTVRIEQIEKEAGGKLGMPPLIPIYIVLGAKFFGFNLDALFNTVDGLVGTDLADLTVDSLRAYMRENAEGFHAYQVEHRDDP